MRLIKTSTLELHAFGSDIPEYVILSHRWRSGRGEEATLQEFQEFSIARSRSSKESEAVRNIHAELAGLRLRLQNLEERLERGLDRLRELSIREHETSTGRCAPDNDVAQSRLPDDSSLRNSPSPWRADTVSASPGVQKVLDFCRTAKDSGYEWAWIDTVCIDKTNNAELSESINSMWDWYANAKVCFAHLHDVHSREKPNSSEGGENKAWTELRESDWFTRGWTLQELIAPDYVVFYNSTWSVLGSRHSLQDHLSAVTGIPVDVMENPDRIEWYTSAQRMSWAAKRITTREEDIAYCLLGLVNVNMELLYGEGGVKAFRRLQIKILEEFDDETLLTWQVLEDDFCAKEIVLIRDIESGQWLPTKCALTGFLAERPEQFCNAGDITDSDCYLPETPLEITSWGIKIERDIYELAHSRMQWKYSRKQTQGPNVQPNVTPVEDPTTLIKLVPLSCGPASSDSASHIAVTRDRTAKFENRLCRLHLLDEWKDRDYIRRLICNESLNMVKKQFFVRLSWPVDTNSWRHDAKYSPRKKQTVTPSGSVYHFRTAKHPAVRPYSPGGP